MDKYYGEWVPYSGNSTMILGGILLIVTAVLICLGFALKKALIVRIPGKAATLVMFAVWILSMVTFAANADVYSLLLNQAEFIGTTPENPITKYTFTFALLSLLTVTFINRKKGKKVAFCSGVLAAMAGPMIFEMPFDLIVIGRTYPPIPPDPAALRALFFFPLFLIELTTMSLLFLSPLLKFTKYTLYCLAGMFFVFAIWGFFGFSFAYTTIFFIFNVASKALAFVTVITVFLPEEYPAPERQLLFR